MPRIDNATFYTKAIERYGYGAKGLNWSSKKTQQLRFEVIYALFPEDIGELKIVDAGCGFGDFYLFLKSKGERPRAYVGYDVHETMVAVASQKTAQRCEVCDILKDPLEEADYYIASGSMNILHPFETVLFIERCFEASRKGFIFNLLSGDDKGTFFNHWPLETLRAYLETLNADVRIQEGYLHEDVTVLLRKPVCSKKS